MPTLYTFSLLGVTDDPVDKRYLLGEEQYVMWAAGPVGSIDTTLGSLAVPFRHYSRASVSGKMLD